MRRHRCAADRIDTCVQLVHGKTNHQPGGGAEGGGGGGDPPLSRWARHAALAAASGDNAGTASSPAPGTASAAGAHGEDHKAECPRAGCRQTDA